MFTKPMMKFALSLVLAATLAQGASAAVIYDSIPAVYPPNLPSLGYQATQTREFGDHIQFAGTARDLSQVTVAMSNWALLSTYANTAWANDPTGYNHDLTMTLYNVVAGATPTVGTQIAAQTINAHVPWRPEPYVVGGTPYNGILFNAVFDFSSFGVTLPDEIIFGLSFNTQTYGANPIGVTGPYNSLNFGLSGGAIVGTDVNPDALFWNTSTAAWYADGGPGGTFRQDTEWTGYVPAARFETSEPVVPEPATLSLLGLGLAGLGAMKRRRARRA